MRITSLQNPVVKHIAKLRSDARLRRQEGRMLVEGWDEISLAQNAGYKPAIVVTAEEFVKRPLERASGELLHVSPAVFQKLSARENPDGWMAIFETPHTELVDLHLGSAPLLIVVEAIEKPGNLGAIFRSCDAAGVDAVIVCDPRADMYGPNVVRASRGTVFTVPAVAAESREALAFLRARSVRIAAASPAASVEYTRQDLRGPLAIALGTEDRGLSDEWLQQADITLKIPMRGRINSLNVSVATALLVFEALRQRGT